MVATPADALPPGPDWLARPPRPPLPGWPVWWRVTALFLMVIVAYNVSGFYLEPWLERTFLAFCRSRQELPCVPTAGGFTAGGTQLLIELYWLPGIWSLIGLVIFVFPGPVLRRVLAAGLAVVTVALLWMLQVGAAVALTAHGWQWAANLDYGPVAVVVAFVSFVGGFVILISVMLAGRRDEPAQVKSEATSG